MTKISPTVETVRNCWEQRRTEIVQLFRKIWDQPELGNQEYAGHAMLCDWLENQGFAVERGTCGLPTAFRAERGSGGPTIIILAEYDALPGTDNDAVPYRKRRGLSAGHACGHNQIGPANCGAAIAAAQAAERLGLPGRIVVLGTPAEEIVWGKVALLDLGGFDGADAILTSHGDYQNGAISRPCQSVVSGEIIFLGESGHAGSNRKSNALDAAELAVQSIERLRAHHFTDAIVEHVLRVGGLIPTVTPDESRLWLTARHVDIRRAREVYDFIVAVANQAAETIGIGFRHQFISSASGYLANDTLAEHLHASLEIVGPPKWRDPDTEFMRQLSQNVRPEGGFTLDRNLGIYRDGVDPYGQDDGEASWRIPLGRINWAFPEQVPLHHWALTALCGHESSDAGPLMASEALAIATIGLLENPEIVVRAKAELRDRVAGRKLETPRFGALQTMRDRPETFWDATWIEE